VYVSKKDDKGNWGKFENFPFNSDEYSIGHPAISADGQTIYFVSDMPGGFGQTDIYETHQENGTWSKPTNLGEVINSPGKEMFPTVFNDGTLFYSSDGNAGLGGLDIYMSTPQNKRFTSILNLGYPLNSNADDFSLLLNSDFKSGFMSSNRAGGKGYDDIYSFTSSKEIITQFTINVIVRNKLSREPISYSHVDLYDESGNPPYSWTENLFFDPYYNLNANYDASISPTSIKINSKLPIAGYTFYMDKPTYFTLSAITPGAYSSGGENNIVKKVPSSADFGYQIIDQMVSDHDFLSVERMTLSTIDFQVKDVKGNLVPFHGSPISFTIKFSLQDAK
jgi:hypothetical protein